MRAIVLAVALAALCSFVASQEDLPEFFPCSFSVSFNSEITNLQGEIVATSIDRLIRDGEQDLWRWESDFTGLPGVLDPQQWIVIWRPDMNVSYHDLGEKCIKNNGRKTMAPLPYDWVLEKTGGMTWFRNVGTWEGAPCYIYHTTFVVKEYQTTMTADVHILKSGALVLVNGTAKSDKYGLDLKYSMDVQYYDHNQEFLPTYFIPAGHCTNGTPIPAPSPSSAEFQKQCYGNFGAHAVASWAMVVLLLVAALLL